MVAADQLKGNGCTQKADGRADTGIGRHDDASDAKLLRQPRGMERGRAAEGDKGVFGDDLAALHRMNAGGIRHVLVDDLSHAIASERRGEAEARTDISLQRGRGLGAVQRQAASGEARRIDAAEDAALLRAAFQREYVALFSRTIPLAELEILTWSLTVSTEPERAAAAASAVAAVETPLEAGQCRLFDPETGGSMEAPVYWRPHLARGTRLSGPAVIAEDETTTFVTAAFDGVVNARGCIVLERRSNDD